MSRDKVIIDAPFRVDSITFCNRKTVRVSVNPQGKLLIRAPHGTSREYLVRILTERKDWIEKYQNNAALKQQQLRSLSGSNRIYYLGKEYPVELIKNASRNDVIIDDETITISTKPDADPFSVMIRRFSADLREFVIPYIIDYSVLLEVCCNKLTITSAKARWGSCCNKRKSICFTWRLVMAPPEVIEYLVLHEATHLKFPNHSKDFWQQVEKLLPEWKERLQWLKDNVFLMKIDRNLFE